MAPSLVVVRGSYRGADPTYACTAHDTQNKHSVMLKVDHGKVAERTLVPASERKTVEAAMRVWQRVRRQAHGPRPAAADGPRAQEADLARMRRYKSDDELHTLRGLSRWSAHRPRGPRHVGELPRRGGRRGLQVGL